MSKLILAGAIAFASTVASAQATLPQGIGLYQYGFRSYRLDGHAYDAEGTRRPIGDRYARELSGPSLRAGGGGERLERLTDELDRMDPGAGGGAGLVDRLHVGRVTTDVKAEVTAQYLGFGYGVTRHVTLYGAVPWVKAKTEASLRYEGALNNAAALRDELGGLAYEELAQGLTEAAAIGDAQVAEALAAYDYEPLGSWRKEGVGDVVLGARSGLRTPLARRVAAVHGVDARLTLPTGYVESPHVLQDVGFGDGHAKLGVTASESLQWRAHGAALGLGVELGYRLGAPATVTKRVPERGETSSLVPRERTARVTITPGDETETALLASAGYGVLAVEAKRGRERRFADRFRGELPGNYDALGVGTDKVRDYAAYALKLDTTTAYRQGRVALPAIVTLSLVETVGGVSTFAERYVELGVTSFFK